MSSAGTSVGPINTAGPYTYSLACTGPGGASAPQSVNVTVNSPVPGSVSNFLATPSSIQAGGTTSLSWGRATPRLYCQRRHGQRWLVGFGRHREFRNRRRSDSPGGNLHYTLTCSGPGGTGTPTSVAVNVSAAPTPTASVRNSAQRPPRYRPVKPPRCPGRAMPRRLCTASGGTGAWGGTVPAVSTGTTTGAIATAGSYTYTLTCTGPGGTGTPSSTTVNVINASGSAASIGAFSAASTNVQTWPGHHLVVVHEQRNVLHRERRFGRFGRLERRRRNRQWPAPASVPLAPRASTPTPWIAPARAATADPARSPST